MRVSQRGCLADHFDVAAGLIRRTAIAALALVDGVGCAVVAIVRFGHGGTWLAKLRRTPPVAAIGYGVVESGRGCAATCRCPHPVTWLVFGIYYGGPASVFAACLFSNADDKLTKELE